MGCCFLVDESQGQKKYCPSFGSPSLEPIQGPLRAHLPILDSSDDVAALECHIVEAEDVAVRVQALLYCPRSTGAVGSAAQMATPRSDASFVNPRVDARAADALVCASQRPCEVKLGKGFVEGQLSLTPLMDSTTPTLTSLLFCPCLSSWRQKGRSCSDLDPVSCARESSDEPAGC